MAKATPQERGTPLLLAKEASRRQAGSIQQIFTKDKHRASPPENDLPSFFAYIDQCGGTHSPSKPKVMPVTS